MSRNDIPFFGNNVSNVGNKGLSQADWDESDKTAPSYINNRPFYVDKDVYKNFPDADYINPVLSDGGASIYKISDTPINRIDFGGNYITYHLLNNPSEIITEKLEVGNGVTITKNDETGEWISTTILDDFLIYYTKVQLTETYFLEKGIYVLQEDSASDIKCLDNLTFINKIVQIPEKFVPKNYYTMTETDDKFLQKTDYDPYSKIHLTFANQPNLSYLFSGSTAKSLPQVNTAFATDVSYMFNDCTQLETINGVLDFSKVTDFSWTFEKCYNLKEIRILNSTISESISFASSSKLSDDSLNSIVGGLKSVSTTKKLTLNSIVLNKLTKGQLALIANLNWTVG